MLAKNGCGRDIHKTLPVQVRAEQHCSPHGFDEHFKLPHVLVRFSSLNVLAPVCVVVPIERSTRVVPLNYLSRRYAAEVI